MTETYDPIQKFTAIESYFPCRTTPEYLLEVIKDFNAYYSLNLPLPALVVYQEPLMESERQFEITCKFQDGDAKWTVGIGWFDLIQSKSDVTYIRLRNADDELWILNYFRALESHLQEVYSNSYSLTRESITHLLTASNGGQVKNTNAKPGRRRLLEDEWARREYHISRRDKMAVYQEWVIKPEVKARQLADPLDSFEKLLKKKPEGE